MPQRLSLTVMMKPVTRAMLARSTAVRLPLVLCVAAILGASLPAPASSPPASPEPAAAGVTFGWFCFEPAVIPDTYSDRIPFRIEVLGGHDAVTLELTAGGEVPLIELEPRVWGARLEADDVLFGYTPSDANHNFVGRVAVRENGIVLVRFNLFAPVSDASVPPIATTSPASDMLAGERVVNIHYPDLSFPTPANVQQVAKRFYEVFPDDYDFLNIVTVAPGFQANRTHLSAKNEVQGIGRLLFDLTFLWGSAGRLQGGNIFPIPTYFDPADLGAQHEIGHQWINHFTMFPPLAPGPHWPAGTQARGVMGGFGSGQGLNFPYQLIPLPNGDYRMQLAPLLREFTDLDLYLMGLLGPEDVGPNFVFSDPNQQICNGCSGPVTFFTIDDVIQSVGPRIPDATQAQKEFKVATLVVSRDRLLTPEELAYFDYFARRGEARLPLRFTSGFDSGLTKPFHMATRGLGSLDTSLAPRVGTGFCTSTTNSTGIDARLTAAGSTSLLDNDLVLTAHAVPNETFLFFYGPTQVQLPAGNGFLCVGSQRRILPVGTATEHFATRRVDLQDAAITVPGTVHFQCWFQDPAAGGAGFDTSDGLTITFTP